MSKFFGDETEPAESNPNRVLWECCQKLESYAEENKVLLTKMLQGVNAIQSILLVIAQLQAGSIDAEGARARLDHISRATG